MGLTIVGIDPGTTTALAILDLEGHILAVSSSRVHNASAIIEEIIARGRPIIVGCDKRSPPAAVAAISRKLGCCLVCPSADLKAEEKKSLADRNARNTHELDALAAAVYAWERYRELFQKIDRVLDDRDKPHLRDAMKEFLVKNEEINIAEAIQILETPGKTPVEGRHREREPPLVQVLQHELAMQEELFHLLKGENKRLRRAREEVEQRPVKKKGRDEILREKESALHALARKSESQESTVIELRQEIESWKDFLKRAGPDMLVLQRYKDFSLATWKDQEQWDQEMLFIDFPEVRHETVMRKLSQLRILVTPRIPRHETRLFCVQATHLSLHEKGPFALVKKSELDAELKKKNVLADVIKEYQASRTK
jgi:predicted RNase H-like nuclease (RuvC/YqgF family)